jgi:hypothetical protein
MDEEVIPIKACLWNYQKGMGVSIKTVGWIECTQVIKEINLKGK